MWILVQRVEAKVLGNKAAMALLFEDRKHECTHEQVQHLVKHWQDTTHLPNVLCIPLDNFPDDHEVRLIWKRPAFKSVPPKSGRW